MVYRAGTNWSNPRSALSSCAKTVTKFTSCVIHGIAYILAPNLKHHTLTQHNESVLETAGQDILKRYSSYICFTTNEKLVHFCLVLLNYKQIRSPRYQLRKHTTTAEAALTHDQQPRAATTN